MLIRFFDYPQDFNEIQTKDVFSASDSYLLHVYPMIVIDNRFSSKVHMGLSSTVGFRTPIYNTFGNQETLMIRFGQDIQERLLKVQESDITLNCAVEVLLAGIRLWMGQLHVDSITIAGDVKSLRKWAGADLNTSKTDFKKSSMI
ncbi:hypothetical protein RF11_08934 [Thelohanellus kitauei]|uniref:Uncharacterized protein n=1 Tax=Thelohanellus kitauei TaxID=669202 RepID=A0A0C2IBP9_THEKT|nr:hypothetical protein RF11_08934 [Thelohanellus kitauei]